MEEEIHVAPPPNSDPSPPSLAIHQHNQPSKIFSPRTALPTPAQKSQIHLSAPVSRKRQIPPRVRSLRLFDKVSAPCSLRLYPHIQSPAWSFLDRRASTSNHASTSPMAQKAEAEAAAAAAGNGSPTSPLRTSAPLLLSPNPLCRWWSSALPRDGRDLNPLIPGRRFRLSRLDPRMGR